MEPSSNENEHETTGTMRLMNVTMLFECRGKAYIMRHQYRNMQMRLRQIFQWAKDEWVHTCDKVQYQVIESNGIIRQIDAEYHTYIYAPQTEGHEEHRVIKCFESLECVISG